jgi:hypothetical protein
MLETFKLLALCVGARGWRFGTKIENNKLNSPYIKRNFISINRQLKVLYTSCWRVAYTEMAFSWKQVSEGNEKVA